MPELTACDLELAGCSPEPLMAYLKALGILRLVSEQVDPGARGWWKNDTFWLRSRFDRCNLLKFFLNEYKPTPILAPWAGGSGFFKKGNKNAVPILRDSTSLRVIDYALAIKAVQEIIKLERIDGKPKDEDKARLIRRYRRELPDEILPWMDAAMVLQNEGQAFAPLLGTGGNDGNLDFTQNFMQRIVKLGLHESSEPSDDSRSRLSLSLFADSSRLDAASVGQFAPGRAGGPNATQGMKGDSVDNPWDFILMLEGSLLLAGAACRRLGVTESGRAAFPFTVRALAAGFTTSATSEEADSRGELWLPYWTRKTSLDEIRSLFSEARTEVTGRPARNGVDFARAVSGFGVDRGIDLFVRLGFLKRSGKAYLAAPLGRFEVKERPHVDLLREIDPWLDSFRRAAGDKNAPIRFSSALRAIDSAIFEFCRYGGNPFFQKILIALGRAERELALTPGKLGQSKFPPNPLVGLSKDWAIAIAANDSTKEFQVAQALAGVHTLNHKIGSLRANIEPVSISRRNDGTLYAKWAEKDRSVVWNAADLSTNLAAVLDRRVMDGARKGCEDLPLESNVTASPGAIAAFLAGDLNDKNIEDLLWGLMLVENNNSGSRQESRQSQPHDLWPPSVYCLLKLLFLPRALIAERREENRVIWRLARPGEKGTHRIRPEPAILALLKAGRAGDAMKIAMRRLRASGLTPLPHRRSGGVSRDHEWTGVRFSPREGHRLAAALLIPIHSSAVNALVHRATRGEDFEEQIVKSKPQAIAASSGE